MGGQFAGFKKLNHKGQQAGKPVRGSDSIPPPPFSTKGKCDSAVEESGAEPISHTRE